ncbi:MAG: aminoglycoside 3'-phosphotransferase [Ruminococcaceae bacterium]|nr:aminoglycoside 3'-phosphotransferase [Oscillospiraceae bacterium]
MQKKPAILTKADIPAAFHSFLDGAAAFDSSCSKTAQVWFLDKGPGYFLKKAPKGTLKNEAAMTAFFSSKNLAPEVLAYESYTEDWMLTLRAKGEDCLLSMYTDDPKKLCDTTAQLLRMLHESDTANCPVADRTRDYLSTTIHNFHHKNYDSSLFPDNWGYATAEEAWQELEANGRYLQSDTLLHGDYCLPNIMLDNWQFSAFIDLDNAGVGDRHVDLFWGMWSLQFNLKTDAYRERFLDVYGRDKITQEVFRTVAAAEVFG